MFPCEGGHISFGSEENCSGKRPSHSRSWEEELGVPVPLQRDPASQGHARIEDAYLPLYACRLSIQRAVGNGSKEALMFLSMTLCIAFLHQTSHGGVQGM